MRTADVAAFGFEGAFEGHQLVFVDGRFAPGLSSITPEGGLQIRSLGDVLSREPERLQSHLGRVVSDAASSFADLNAAFFEDGAFVFIPPGLAVDEPGFRVVRLLRIEEVIQLRMTAYVRAHGWGGFKRTRRTPAPRRTGSCSRAG